MQASGSADVARVPESASEGTFVAHLVVSDPDEGRNGRFDCVINSPTAENSFRLMTVAEGEYQLLTTATLDRELVDEYRLSVVCEDGGQPPLMTSASLLVQVRNLISVIQFNKLKHLRFCFCGFPSYCNMHDGYLDTTKRLIFFLVISEPPGAVPCF